MCTIIMIYIKNIFRFINELLAFITIWFIKVYQIILSPDKWIPSFWLKWKVCLHTPHCSEYWINVLKRYGFIPWIFYTMDRVASCHPWNDNHYDPAFFKVVYMSSAPIWTSFLEKLFEDKRFDVVWVVTAPDKPIWRWMQLWENVIKTLAKKCFEKKWKTNFEDLIKTPEKINPDKSQEWKDFYEWLKNLDCDFLVVVAYWKIIPVSVLEIANKGPINVHGSILPKYRGASPIQSVLLDWYSQTWLTIMLMSEKMDEWDMLKKLLFDVWFHWTSKDIIDKMMELWPDLLVDTLWEYGKWNIKPISQDSSQATYCKKIEKEDWIVDLFNESLESIYNKYRWYYLWPKIWLMLDEKFWKFKDKRLIIESIEIDEKLYDSNKDKSFLDNDFKLNSALISCRVKPEWKKSMNFIEFLNWYIK